MRRENRRKNKLNSNMSVYITGGVLLVAIATFVITFILYSNKLDDDLYALDSEYLSKYNYITTEDENTTSASSSIGKTVEESKNNTTRNNSNVTEENNINNNVVTTKTTTNKSTSTTSKKTKKDPVFQKPIEGEISKEFAKDRLIY